MWELMLPFRGHPGVLDILDVREFVEEGADIPLESVGRVSMRVIGCP